MNKPHKFIVCNCGDRRIDHLKPFSILHSNVGICLKCSCLKYERKLKTSDFFELVLFVLPFIISWFLFMREIFYHHYFFGAGILLIGFIISLMSVTTFVRHKIQIDMKKAKEGL